MKLIYIRIQKSQIGINEEELNFSDQFEVDLVDNNLVIKEKEYSQPSIYSSHISNLSLLVGKNGTGKSTILESIALNGYYKNKFLKSFHTLAIYFIGKAEYDGKEYPWFYIELDSYVARRVKNIKRTGVHVLVDDNFIRIDNRTKFFRETKMPEDYHRRDLVSYIRMQPNIDWLARKEYINETLERDYFTTQISSFGKLSDLIQFISENDELKVIPEIEFKIKSQLPYQSPAQLFYLYHVNNDRQYDSFDSFYREFYKENQIKVYNVDNRNIIPVFQNKQFIINYLERKLLNLIEIERRKTDQDLIRILDKITKERDGDFSWYLNQQGKEFNITRTSRSLRTKIIREIPAVEATNRARYFTDCIKYLTKAISIFSEEKVDFNVKILENLLKLGNVVAREPTKWKTSVELISSQEQRESIQILVDSEKDLVVKFSKISDGESVFLNTFSTIFSILKNDKYDNKIILLDEPDLNLHPELARNFINTLNNIIEKYFVGNSLQLIISTHSPYIVTDVPKESVFNLIDREDYLGEIGLLGSDQRILIRNAEVSFGANIFDLMSDSFFLKATIGEFAKEKIIQMSKDKNLRDSLQNYIDDPVLKSLFTKGS